MGSFGLPLLLLLIFYSRFGSSKYLPLIAREDVVTFGAVPDCTNKTCFPFHSSSIGCHRFSQSCFCGALQPLECAYTSCLGNDWYGLEDWYATVCPQVPIIDFSRFARCGRECIRESIVPSWCNATVVGTNSPTRNCFCRITEKGFSGFDRCLVENCEMNRTDAQEYLLEFWKVNCLLPSDGEGSTSTDVSDQVVQFPRLPQPQSAAASDDGPLSKAEPVGLIVGLLSGFITLIGTGIAFWKKCLCFKRRGNRSTGSSAVQTRGTDEPPPYSSAWGK